MKKNDIVDIVIPHQGLPIVGNICDACIVDYVSDGILLVSVDMKSKWCVVSGTCGSLCGDDIPGVWVSPTDESTDLDPDFDGDEWDEGTFIQFPSLQGWHIWTSSLNRYTLRVCFTRSYYE